MWQSGLLLGAVVKDFRDGMRLGDVIGLIENQDDPSGIRRHRYPACALALEHPVAVNPAQGDKMLATRFLLSHTSPLVRTEASFALALPIPGFLQGFLVPSPFNCACDGPARIEDGPFPLPSAC